MGKKQGLYQRPEYSLSPTGKLLVVSANIKRNLFQLEGRSRVILWDTSELKQKTDLPPDVELVVFTKFVDHNDSAHLRILYDRSTTDGRKVIFQAHCMRISRIKELATVLFASSVQNPEAMDRQKLPDMRKGMADFVRANVNLHADPNAEGPRLLAWACESGFQFDRSTFQLIFNQVRRRMWKEVLSKESAKRASPIHPGFLEWPVQFPSDPITATTFHAPGLPEVTSAVEAFGRGDSVLKTDPPKMDRETARAFLSQAHELMLMCGEAIRCLLEDTQKG